MSFPAPVTRAIRLLHGESLAGSIFRLGNGRGVPYDLYGGSARMGIKRSPGDTVAILTLESPESILLDPIEGTLEPVASAELLATIAPIVARYDLFFTDSRGRSRLIATGIFSVAAANTEGS